MLVPVRGSWSDPDPVTDVVDDPTETGAASVGVTVGARVLGSGGGDAGTVGGTTITGTAAVVVVGEPDVVDVVDEVDTAGSVVIVDGADVVVVVGSEVVVVVDDVASKQWSWFPPDLFVQSLPLSGCGSGLQGWSDAPWWHPVWFTELLAYAAGASATRARADIASRRFTTADLPRTGLGR